MNENEFNLDFDFEKEYGIDPPKEENLPQEDIDFDLKELLGTDFDEDAAVFNSEYTANFDYGPDPDLSVPGLNDPVIPPDYMENPSVEYEPEISQAEESQPETAKPETKPASEEGGRRRKPLSPMRKFKNEKLPLIIMGVAALLCVIFIFGSIGRAITKARMENDARVDASESQQSEQQRQEAEAKKLLAEAEALAAGYDYQGAINLLNTFTGDSKKFTDIEQRKADYEMAKSQLVAHNDPSEVANLSFHGLIADPSRAFSNSDLAGQYNKNFVTTDEFEAILAQLYANNYVLVDMDSFVNETTTGDATTYEAKTLYLPDGKKPIMITETYGYLLYSVDSNDDGEPDKDGAGFASRLVIDGNGDIKAEMVDAEGNTVVGNYSLVPILNDFIAEHPDFSYQGARAIIAVTGEDGVFGYRINNEVINAKGQEYYNEQAAGAQKIADALRAEGYVIACYTYANKDYGKLNASSIQEDIDLWNRDIVSVIGHVNTLVYAKSSDISTTGNYSGNKYNVLQEEGFRYYITSGSKPSATINGDYVRQVRLMVTGSMMYHTPTMYSSYFDAKSVLNSQRGNVPQ